MKKTTISVLGRTTRDRILKDANPSFGERTVTLRINGDHIQIRHEGHFLKWGDKRSVLPDSHQIVHEMVFPQCESAAGGGLFHTVQELANTRDEYKAHVDIKAFHTESIWEQLASSFERLGVQHEQLGNLLPDVNLVMYNKNAGDRLILRVHEDDTKQVVSTVTIENALRDSQVLAINYPSTGRLTHDAVSFAAAYGIHQFSVVNGSLPIEQTVELMLTHDQVSICNLNELSVLAKHLQIPCPADETGAESTDIAKTLRQLATTIRTGDIVVTMGRRGLTLLLANTFEVYHICLETGISEFVQRQLDAKKINGAGDRWFARFVFHLLNHNTGRFDTVSAALVASVDAVRILAPTMDIHDSDFDVLRMSRVRHQGRMNVSSSLQPCAGSDD